MVRTATMVAALRRMADAEAEGRYEDAEIVCCGLDCWIGDTRTSHAVVRALLYGVAVSDVSEGSGTRRYALNGVGRAAVRRPEVLEEAVTAILSGRNVTLDGDRIVPLDPP